MKLFTLLMMGAAGVAGYRWWRSQPESIPIGLTPEQARQAGMTPEMFARVRAEHAEQERQTALSYDLDGGMP